VRAYLLAIGLTVFVLGLFLLFAGYVHIGCVVGGTSSNPTFTDCAGAVDLEVTGTIFIVVAGALFVGSLLPDRSSPNN
jgi:hypothetical protein